MTNTTSISENLDSAEPRRQSAPKVETQEIIEAVRSCLHVSLTGEAQNFRSWVAAAHRKSSNFQRLALATTAMACLFSLFILLATIWEARRITHQAEAQLHLLQQQAAASSDAFAELRRSNWQPAGKLITQKGRTFIELKSTK
ncbi:MAG TPA: hypothetical protein VL970_01925 [Candidatus Acidoferrales bacterium]|nr:hypothetical protein [Candidatus Acidoferrales bacterium]